VVLLYTFFVCILYSATILPMIVNGGGESFQEMTTLEVRS
jgi:hypothetical protein